MAATPAPPTVANAQPAYVNFSGVGQAVAAAQAPLIAAAREQLAASRQMVAAINRGNVGGGGSTAAANRGNFGASEEKKLADTEGAIRRLGYTMESVWSRGKAGLLDLVSVADPSAFSTFNASVTSVGIQVGQVFVPAVLALSGSLQGVAGWFAALDPYWKSSISSTVQWAVALGATYVAWRGIVTVINLAKAAQIAFNAAAMANPMGLVAKGVGLVLGAVGLMSAAWSGAGRAAATAGSEMEAAVRRVELAFRRGETASGWIQRQIRTQLERTTGAGGGPVQNLQLPFQSRVTSFEQYGESLQVDALKTNDADKQNQLEVLRAMLSRMDGQQRLLEQIAGGGGMERALRGIFG